MNSLTTIARDILQLKAAAATASTDLRKAIHGARATPPRPTHTRAQLEAYGAADSLQARIARGWVRIGFMLPDNARRPTAAAPEIDPAVVLPQMAGYLYADPLKFVMFAFDFGHDRALRVVKMPASYADYFDSEFGIEQWACEFFDEIGGQVRERAFDGSTPVDAIRHAVASGHGVSKSATTAMLVNWIMATRPNARGVVTANTAPQLESKTWAELAKWTKRSVFSEWFDVTTGRGSMKMVAKTAPESWNVYGQTSREENSESFAGLHAADSTAFYIFDEASAIPAKIWEVAEGGMTDGSPMFYAFGNPTRTGTKFFECFNAQRHRWITRQVDSRTCQLTNKDQLQQWIDDYGQGSDFTKVRVLGQFPSASSLQFIGRDLVEDAMQRDLPDSRGEAVVLGVDVARFGDDQTVIVTRVGRDAREFPIIRMANQDTMQVAARVAERANLFRSAGRMVQICVDSGGVGGGVTDRLRQLGFDVTELQFGSRANDPRKYANKRAELWSLMKDWLTGGALPQDADLLADLTSVEYGFNQTDAILLEKKADMKRRGLASPDAADALACCFGVTPAIPMADDLGGGREAANKRRLARLNAVSDVFAHAPGTRKKHDPFTSMA